MPQAEYGLRLLHLPGGLGFFHPNSEPKLRTQTPNPNSEPKLRTQTPNPNSEPKPDPLPSSPSLDFIQPAERKRREKQATLDFIQRGMGIPDKKPQKASLDWMKSNRGGEEPENLSFRWTKSNEA
ncbi:hypothetical protein [Cohnella algarum]|uniref:hypothetical protein n=1 Tax=Cohnella algarum TaxID=2044859 RepID=UPI0019680340|nr:hypothetical protein [Cohnella algarum]MBN2981349.1 hypothetical protein [Cohnella algarum]